MSFFKQILITFLFLQLQTDFVALDNDLTEININDAYTEVIISFSIEPGYHIQSDKDVPENIIPSSIIFEPSSAFSISLQQLLVPAYDTIYLDKIPHEVISHEFQAKVQLRPLDSKKLTTEKLKGVLTYQACDNRKCYFPRDLKFEIAL
ncbi:disulfide bond corrector protein DsbC [Christiangramia gaetbulicola]|uniref:Disulfide bond corrector protein DsbC n=1 Tax=Christiangramia gaetbulicola TaxID=703340 RepID=A0A2T6AMU3_9FLAO|nr:protein-disulfide reductase DsbD domain-containing protein [Christiangramia gaetbulicola]PTX45149.1 disulfide bond corrector protein DsbC [Christiangramia gaetbulicola]